MKKFSFRLQKVLQLRKFREEECKIALGQAISILNKIESDIKDNAFKRHHAASQRFLEAGQMESWNYFILRLDREAEKLMEQAAQAELVVEEKRALYIEALQDLNALEKLKEKRMEEYRKEVLAAEMLETDELTAARIISS